MRALFLFFFGFCEFYFQKSMKVSGRYLKGRLSFYSLSRRRACLVGICPRLRYRRLCRELARESIAPDGVIFKGLPAILYRRRKRVGLALGVLLCLLIPILSGRYIWQIDVVGNERVSDSEILSLLKSEGVYEGAPSGEIDALAVANRILQKSPSLAFIGVNIVGNRVEAVVLEHKEKGEALEDSTPSNVVAKKNGVIVAVELEGGETKLKVGDTVSVGTLLISGVNQLRGGSYHYQRAKGHVYAETLNEISRTFPLYRYEKVYTGEVFEEKSLIFFTKVKKISKECGNLPLTCDRIETRERVMLFGKVPLPIWITTVRYLAFEPCEVILTEEEAIRSAREAILTELATIPLVSYKEEVTVGERGVTLTVIYRAIEDIAKEYPLFDLP